MILIGGIEDQIKLYVWGEISNTLFSISDRSLANFYVYESLFRDLTSPLSVNQPIMWTFYSVMATIFGGNFLNIFSIITLLTVFVISYFYFKRYIYPLFFSLIFTLSTYSLVHIGRHIALTQIWLIPLFFMVLEMSGGNYKKDIKVAVILSLSVLISNYLGFFLVLTYLVYTLVKIISKKFAKDQTVKILKSFFITIIVITLLLAPMVLPYFKAVYFPSEDAVLNLTRAKKSISDFAAFSSRPWYFITPPVKNPFLGELSSGLLEKIESTGYFLADDYFANEHQANYFGLFFLGSLAYLLTFAIKKIDKSTLRKLLIYLTVALILISFMMPPFLTILGIKIYTPGWLMFKFLPVFRVTARLGVVVHFLLLVVFAQTLQIIKEKGFVKESVIKMMIPLLFIITLAETVIPVKVYKTDEPPEVYEYLGNKRNDYSKIAVFPYSKTDEGFLWLPVHKKLMVNPRGYRNEQYVSEELTKKIPTDEGLMMIKDLGVNYLIIYKEGEKLDFFETSAEMKLEKEFYDSYIYKLL